MKDDSQEHNGAEPGVPNGGVASSILSTEPVRVHLIDDQESISTLFSRMFAAAGQDRFVLSCSGNLRSGIGHIAGNPVDVVLLDLGLPDSRGVDTVKRMHEAAPSLPIVVVSGMDQQDAFFEAMRAGAQDYLLKDQLSGELLVRAVLYAIERKCDEDRLARSHEDMRRLTAHLQSIREDERTRIAREIHDQLGQALTALKMAEARINAIVKRMPVSEERTLVTQRLVDMSDLIDDTIQTVRHISSRLRPGALDDLGLAAAVEWELNEFGRRTGLACRIETEPETFTVEEPAATQLFRVFQEVLTNIARHACASRVCVELRLEGESCLLTVADDGCGIRQTEIDDPGSLGLLGMRERVQLAGGTIAFHGVEGAGTTVRVSLPVVPVLEEEPPRPQNRVN